MSDLLETWDAAATPGPAGLHNGGGFALQNWQLIRAELREARRKAALVDEMRDLNSRHQLGGVFADVLWDVTEDNPQGDPPTSPDSSLPKED
jgi:hypothetical protein